MASTLKDYQSKMGGWKNVLQKRLACIRWMRKKQRRTNERQMETEWQNERRALEGGMRRHLEVAGRKQSEDQELVGTEDGRKDDTAERWKKLYNVIKTELDDLIQITHDSGSHLYIRAEYISMVQDLKRELRGKDDIIEALKAQIVAMEKEEMKKAREVDILRQSLRIIINSTKMSETAR